MQYKGYLLPSVNFLEGLQVEQKWSNKHEFPPQVDYPRLISNPEQTPLGSLKDYEDLLARLTKLPSLVRQVQDLLREGVRQRVTYARESFTGVDAQFEKLQVDVNVSDFYVRFRDMPGSLGRHVVDRLQGSAFKVVGEELLPALRELQEYLKYEYSNHYR